MTTKDGNPSKARAHGTPIRGSESLSSNTMNNLIDKPPRLAKPNNSKRADLAREEVRAAKAQFRIEPEEAQRLVAAAIKRGEMKLPRKSR